MPEAMIKSECPVSPEKEAIYQREVHLIRVRSWTMLAHRFCYLLTLGHNVKPLLKNGVSNRQVADDAGLDPTLINQASRMAGQCAMPNSAEELFGMVIWAGTQGSFDNKFSWVPAHRKSPDPVTKFILGNHHIFHDALMAYLERMDAGTAMPLRFVEHHVKMHLGRIVRASNVPGIVRALRKGLRTETSGAVEFQELVSAYSGELVTADLVAQIAREAIELVDRPWWEGMETTSPSKNLGKCEERDTIGT